MPCDPWGSPLPTLLWNFHLQLHWSSKAFAIYPWSAKALATLLGSHTGGPWARFHLVCHVLLYCVFVLNALGCFGYCLHLSIPTFPNFILHLACFTHLHHLPGSFGKCLRSLQAHPNHMLWLIRHLHCLPDRISASSLLTPLL